MGELAAGQHGVVSRWQLRELGLADVSIEHGMATGRLYPLFHAVYAVGHPRVGDRGRMLAAVLACREGAVVSHGTAAALLGLWDRPPALLNVIAPVEAGRKIDGIRKRHVLRPTPEEMGIVEGIPCTSPSRTLVDVAGDVGDRSLRRTVERSAVMNILDVPAIDRVLARGRRRGSARLRTVLEAWRPHGDPIRLRSELEAMLLALCTAKGLPVPRCNVVVKAAGRDMEVDFLWKERRLIVEADGRRFHAHSAAFDRDSRRDRHLVQAGYQVIRVTWAHLEKEPEETMAAIRQVLAR